VPEAQSDELGMNAITLKQAMSINLLSSNFLSVPPHDAKMHLLGNLIITYPNFFLFNIYEYFSTRYIIDHVQTW